MRSQAFIALYMSAALVASPLIAGTLQDEFVSELQSQGFGNISISRTWLGRTRITATNGGVNRELVFNANSGEILRDYSEKTTAAGPLPATELLNTDDSNSSESGSGNDGGGTSGGDNSGDNSGGDNGGGGTSGSDNSGGDSGSGTSGGGGGEQSSLILNFDYVSGGNSHDIAFS